MFAKRHVTLLAAAASAAALTAPSGAHAAGSACLADLPAAGGATWEVGRDGSLRDDAELAGGSNFDLDHARLAIGNGFYPKLDNAELACTVTPTAVLFPVRNVEGFHVSRTVESINGTLRHIDTIHNPAGVQKAIDVTFTARVRGQQVLIESESGDANVNSSDHWSLHKNAGASFPFLRWGLDGHDATVVSLGPDPANWAPDINTMPNAQLVYDDLVVGAGKTVKLLHVAGTSLSQATSRAAAKDAAAAFTGLSRTEAQNVANWGEDPDGDGVKAVVDDCPAVKGDQKNGCLLPPPPENPGEPPAQGGDGGSGGGSAGSGGFGGITPTGPYSGDPSLGRDGSDDGDHISPDIRVSGLRRTIRRSRLTSRRGITARIGCDEACSIAVRVRVRRRGTKRATTVLTRRAPRSSGRGTFRLKVNPRRLRGLARREVTVEITAYDASGNGRTITRKLRLR